MAAKAADFALTAYPDGRLKLTLQGKHFTLRKPTIGEQWGFDEKYAEVIAAEQEDTEWALEALGDTDATEASAILAAVRASEPVEAAKRKRRRQEILLGWWLEVFDVLGTDIPEMPIEDLPPFLLDFTNVGLAQEAWARNPQVEDRGDG